MRRPAILTSGFGILLVAIANLAGVTALTTREPWFSTAVTLQAYGVSLAVAAFLAALLSAIATSRAFQLDEILRSVEVRLADARDAGLVLAEGNAAADPGSPESAPGASIDSLLDELEDLAATPVVRLERPHHDDIVSLPGSDRTTETKGPGHLIRLLMAEHQALQVARAAVWPTLAGPIVASVFFVVIAGIMLPGSEGFATSNFRLNIALILMLGYGWPILVAWSAAALAWLPSVRERRARPTVSP